MEQQVEFRLTTGKKEGTWALPSSVALRDNTHKPTDYFKGSSSYFVEDNKDTIYKRTPVVFRYNDILSDPACHFLVDADNLVLINYLKSHSLYGKFFKIHNEDEINQGISDFNDKIFEAFTIVNESNDVKVKSIAFAILGKAAIGYTPEKCAAELKEISKKTPELIISKKNAENYEAFYFAALAFNSKIVKSSPDGNHVLWNDDRNSSVLRVDIGENAIEKLGDYLFEGSAKAKAVLQEIGLRIEKLNKTVEPKSSESDLKLLSDKDAEIAELKAQLAKQAEAAAKVVVKDPVAVNTNSASLEEVQEKYEKEIGKLPANKKNDIDWLSNKLDELNQ